MENKNTDNTPQFKTLDNLLCNVMLGESAPDNVITRTNLYRSDVTVSL